MRKLNVDMQSMQLATLQLQQYPRTKTLGEIEGEGESENERESARGGEGVCGCSVILGLNDARNGIKYSS